MSKKPFQDIFTPEEMVKEILNFIPIKDGDKILEPTAGDGNMVVTILEKCKDISIDITANEIQKKHYDTLKKRVSKYGNVTEGDKTPFDGFNHFFGKN